MAETKAIQSSLHTILPRLPAPPPREFWLGGNHRVFSSSLLVFNPVLQISRISELDCFISLCGMLNILPSECLMKHRALLGTSRTASSHTSSVFPPLNNRPVSRIPRFRCLKSSRKHFSGLFNPPNLLPNRR